MSNQDFLRSSNTANGYAQCQFDAVSQEIIVRSTAVIFDEDFIGPGHTTIPSNGSPTTGYPWVQRTVKSAGSPTVAAVANSGGGIVALAQDATSEKQEATLYANDSLNYDLIKYATYEARRRHGPADIAGRERIRSA
jgi:hypothetical protein